MKKQRTDKFVEYIKENKAAIYRLAYSYVKNEQDALDIVQDAIHKAITSLDTLKDADAMKSWFYRIVINTALDFYRKNKKIMPMDDQILEIMQQGKRDAYQNLDLNKALDELPFKYKSIIILKFFEDLKIADIAAILHENQSTIKTRLYKALKLLRVKME
ncbi:RNA polymerase sigma factor [Virgibacillus halophilus]|uniref:RNA polymerase sigma factor n=1 Tax=Tigheibacillus halophilus TaxID=361280 RepID=A0ABU5CA22_9BACI|nr:RNA polymerase sigma factor [Virgibacillus halophilus]